jgi:ketosteroid isomerase-like protein
MRMSVQAPVNSEAVVRAAFETFGRGDLDGFAAHFHADATWNHRNPDRLGGLHNGIDAILAFLRSSGELTAGTLRAVPEATMIDGAALVGVITRISGSRPDGRSFDDRQVLVFTVEEGKVRSVDQYIGDPPTVTDFWA